MTRATRLRQARSVRRLPQSATVGERISRYPVQWGFLASIGVLLGLALASVLISLSSVILAVFIAAFIALGLDPLTRWFERRGLKRPLAVAIVIVLFIGAIASLVSLVLPPVIEQAATFVRGIPFEVQRLQEEGWFDRLDDTTGGLFDTVSDSVQGIITDPNAWAAVAGGAFAVIGSVVNGVSTGLFVFILSIFFMATLRRIKASGFKLVSASRRDGFRSLAERIMDSVGRYLSGMVVLAFLNAVFTTILLSLFGVPYALLLGVTALFITIIPLVGSVIMTVIITLVTLLESPLSALAVLGIMLVYLQIEAYVFTPRVMSQAVQVPGSVVLIAALAGATLLGLLGALVAIPISAAIILIVREVVIPRTALS